MRGVQRPRDAPVRRIFSRRKRGQFRQSCRHELDGAETNEDGATSKRPRRAHGADEEKKRRFDSSRRRDDAPRTKGRSSTEGIEKQSVMGG